MASQDYYSGNTAQRQRQSQYAMSNGMHAPNTGRGQGGMQGGNSPVTPTGQLQPMPYRPMQFKPPQALQQAQQSVQQSQQPMYSQQYIDQAKAQQRDAAVAWQQQQQAAARQGLAQRGLAGGSVDSANRRISNDALNQALTGFREIDLAVPQANWQANLQSGQAAQELAAFQQALQQGQADEYFRAWQSRLGISQQGLDREQLGLQRELGLGNLALEQGKLGLQTELGRGELSLEQQKALDQSQQALRDWQLRQTLGLGELGLSERQLGQQASQFAQELQLKQAEQQLNQMVQTGQLSIAQRDQALNELRNSQQFGLEQQKFGLEQQLGLGGLSQEQQRITNQAQQFLAAQAQQQAQFEAQQALEQKRQELDAQVQLGQLSIAERDQALQELSNMQQRQFEQQQLAQEATLTKGGWEQQMAQLLAQQGFAGSESEKERQQQATLQTQQIKAEMERLQAQIAAQQGQATQAQAAEMAQLQAQLGVQRELGLGGIEVEREGNKIQAATNLLGQLFGNMQNLQGLGLSYDELNARLMEALYGAIRG